MSASLDAGYANAVPSNTPAGTQPNAVQDNQTNVYVRNIPFTWRQKDLLDRFSQFGHVVSAHVMVDPATQNSRGVGFVRYETAQQAQAAITNMNGQTSEPNGKTLIVKLADPPKPPGTSRTNGPAAGGVRMHQGGHAGNGVMMRPGFHPHRGDGRFIPHHHQHDGRRRMGPGPRYYGAYMPPAPRMSSTNVYIGDLPQTVTKEEINELCAKFGSITSFTLLLDPSTQQSKGTAMVRYSAPDQAEAAVAALNGMTLSGATKPLQVRYARIGMTRQRTPYTQGNYNRGAGGYGPRPPMGQGGYPQQGQSSTGGHPHPHPHPTHGHAHGQQQGQLYYPNYNYPTMHQGQQYNMNAGGQYPMNTQPNHQGGQGGYYNTPQYPTNTNTPGSTNTNNTNTNNNNNNKQGYYNTQTNGTTNQGNSDPNRK